MGLRSRAPATDRSLLLININRAASSIKGVPSSRNANVATQPGRFPAHSREPQPEHQPNFDYLVNLTKLGESHEQAILKGNLRKKLRDRHTTRLLFLPPARIAHNCNGRRGCRRLWTPSISSGGILCISTSRFLFPNRLPLSRVAIIGINQILIRTINDIATRFSSFAWPCSLFLRNVCCELRKK